MRGAASGVLVCALLGACVESNSIVCRDGVVCPSGTQCEPTLGLCLVAEQLTGCTEVADDEPCTFDGKAGTCHSGVCLAQTCGDGVIEFPEQCEASDLDGVEGCSDLGYYTDGPVTCAADCTFDRSQCAGICGDGTVDPGEACDARAVEVVAQCDDEALGFYDAGEVHCNAACQYDTTSCTGYCGDNEINGAEVCDGKPPTAGCIGYGFDRGALTCTQCGPGFVGCGYVGWRQQPALIQTFVPYGGMAGTPHDYWVAVGGQLTHITEQTSRSYAFNLAEGLGLVVQGNQVFTGASLGVWHGTTGANGETSFVKDALPGPSVIITALSAVAANDIYAAGNLNVSGGGAGVYHYNGGWTQLTAPTATDHTVTAFHAISATDLWLATHNGSTGILHHYTSSGWQTVSAPSGIFSSNTIISALWAADATHVYVGSDAGFAMWNGSAWAVHTTSGPVRSIHGTSPTDVLVGGYNFVLRFDGNGYVPVGTFDVRGVWSTGSRIYALDFAAGSSHVNVSEGSSYLPNLEILDLYDIVPLATGALILGLYDIGILDANYTPTLYVTPINPPITAIPFAVDQFWVLERESANGYTLIERYDGAWQDLTTSLKAAGATLPTAMWGSAWEDMWVGENNALYHWTGSWTKTTTTYDALELDGLAANDIWLATGSTKVMHYTGTWTETTAPANVTHIDVVSSMLVYGVADNGTVVRWDGATWTTEPITNIVDLWAGSATDVFALDKNSALYRREGSAWAPVRVESYVFGKLAGFGRYVYLIGNTLQALYRRDPW